MIRTVVIDDQTLVRAGILSLLELGSDIEVVAQADDGTSGLEAIRTHRPDVVLLDLRMPRGDGVWVLEQMREDGLETPTLILTTFDDDEQMLQALRAGARGYLLKDVTLEQLLEAVRRLAEGGTHIQPAVTERLLTAVRRGDSPAPLDDGMPLEALTDRETEVLRLLAGGLTNRDISQAMHLAEGTVKNHVSTVLLKLGARDRTTAVLRALHHGLLG